MTKWDHGVPGIVLLPSGRTVRGRGLRRPPPPGPSPTMAVHLTGTRPDRPAWEQEWIRWLDFWIPSDYVEARRVLRTAYVRATRERVEIACDGGVGRTGTGLAALAIFDGLTERNAVDWARATYHPRAVEVPWQRHFLRWLAASGAA
ncbi:MAG TPA: protein-tyrosine phosphatase family protein [Microlunatus sp.]